MLNVWNLRETFCEWMQTSLEMIISIDVIVQVNG